MSSCAAGLCLFHLLQEHDIGLMAENFADRQVEVDRRMVGIGIVPALSELHVELQDFECVHVRGTNRIARFAIYLAYPDSCA